MLPTAPLKPAALSDHAALLEMIGEYYELDGIPFNKLTMGEGLRTLLTTLGFGRVFLILSGTKLAGYSIVTFGFDLEFGGKIGVVTDVYLRPDFRGKGLGTASFSALCELGRSWGLKILHLQPERKNSAAVAFYQKLGFTAQDRLVMNKRLDIPPME